MLIDGINSLENIDINYFFKNNVKFTDDNQDTKLHVDKFISSLANRIYRSRNSLVHRKENKIKYLISDKENEKACYNELALIALVAEQIICNSADNFDIQ